MKYRIEKRYEPLPYESLIRAIISLMVALVVGALIFQVSGTNPVQAYLAMAKGAFGSWVGLSEVMVKAIPLTLTGLAVSIAATMLLWNIGCEGQFVFGAISATWAALFLTPGWPPPLSLAAVIIAGAIGGMAWALIPALLKTRFQVSEILTTLLLNYVAIIIMEHLYFGPWRNPEGFGFPGTPLFPEAATLPRLFSTRIHIGIFIALFFAALLHFLLARSKWGYRVRVIGHGPKAADYAGMKINLELIRIMAISGALAGLAGMGEVAGIHLRLQDGFSVGYGYDGIIVACLAGFRPGLVPLFALVLGSLLIGGEQLQASVHLPASIVQVLEGALLLGFLASEAMLRYRLVHRKSKKNISAGVIS